VLVVWSSFNVQVVELLFNVLPDFSILQVGVQLHQLHVLLFERIQLVKVEPNTEESRENASADVVRLNQVRKHSVQERLRVLALLFLVLTSSCVQSLTQDARCFRLRRGLCSLSSCFNCRFFKSARLLGNFLNFILCLVQHALGDVRLAWGVLTGHYSGRG